MVLVKITAKMPPKRPQMAKFQNAPKQFLEISIKRAGAGQSFKKICQSAYTPLRGRAVKNTDIKIDTKQIQAKKTQNTSTVRVFLYGTRGTCS
jgi:hypothetical protein